MEDSAVLQHVSLWWGDQPHCAGSGIYQLCVWLDASHCSAFVKRENHLDGAAWLVFPEVLMVRCYRDVGIAEAGSEDSMTKYKWQARCAKALTFEVPACAPQEDRRVGPCFRALVRGQAGLGFNTFVPLLLYRANGWACHIILFLTHWDNRSDCESLVELLRRLIRKLHGKDLTYDCYALGTCYCHWILWKKVCKTLN